VITRLFMNMIFKLAEEVDIIKLILVIVGFIAVQGDKQMPAEILEYKHTNRLAGQVSPYLLQHAHNPVDWYPWGDEAFEKAKKEDKPVFLSIGYSTCHWCHVMERESFENEHIAEIMNEHFVSIKVDREQRPDIDEIYMKTVQMMTGSGGWPLSVFLTPEGKPFYGGTYFPPHDNYGRPGFERILLSVAEAWKNNQQKLVDSAFKMSELLQSPTGAIEKRNLSPEILDKAFESFQSYFDAVNGGFGTAPKFPQPTNLSMLLSYWKRTNDDRALNMVEKTLDAMADGGIYDHLGGGFHRYATDEKWLVPHFEKMLYDQALLSKVYLQAYQITKKERYAKVAREIFDYVLRDMKDTSGGFYSAEDADSKGKEGTFYLWDTAQIASVLNEEHAQLSNSHYGVSKKGNFEQGKNILSVTKSIKQLEKEFQKNRTMIEKMLAESRTKLFKQRTKRIRPHRDEKIITGWNGLMISSLAYGGAVLGEEKYIEAAERAAEFVLKTLRKNGRLMRYYKDGHVVEKAFLDDYAFMVMGLLDIYEATFDVKWLAEAKSLGNQMIELFADTEKGGFFLTGKDSEKLIARTKPSSDGAVPSANSAAAMALLKLGRLTMDQRFTELGGKVLDAFSQQLQLSPEYSSAMLRALDFQLGPTREIIIAGNTDKPGTQKMLQLIHEKFLPNTVVLLHESDKDNSAFYDIVPFVKNQTVIDGKTTAYVCENYTCNKPVNNIAEFENLIDAVPVK
jgi:uncharacterized protein YyaL (SSP411 family)